MDRVCPLLALAADRRTAVDGVDAAHRCHALQPPAVLERDRQSQVCLSVAHQRCERYLAHLGRIDRSRVVDAGIGDGLHSTRLILTPEPSWRGMAGRARRSPRSAAVVSVIALVALGGATAVAAGIGSPPAVAVASPSQTPTAVQTPSPSEAPPSSQPSPAPSAAATPTPTATPTMTPTPVPATAAATPQPTPQRTYVVQAGDTLAFIAQQFGVSVSALQSANGIADANQIIIGDVLVIP